MVLQLYGPQLKIRMEVNFVTREYVVQPSLQCCPERTSWLGSRGGVMLWSLRSLVKAWKWRVEREVSGRQEKGFENKAGFLWWLPGVPSSHLGLDFTPLSISLPAASLSFLCSIPLLLAPQQQGGVPKQVLHTGLVTSSLHSLLQTNPGWDEVTHV